MVIERQSERAILVPPYVAPSEEELKRRRAVFNRTLERRERMQPLGCSMVELLRDHEDKEQPEAKNFNQ